MYKEVLEFCFQELKAEDFFKKDAKLDEKIREKFFDLHQRAQKGELYTWRENNEGRLAEIIILDQFSRNLFRNSPKAFENDAMALILAQEAYRLKIPSQFPPAQKLFFYLPYMHSESVLIHQQALILFQEKGLEKNYRYELEHFEMIERFGRFPYRNSILGRKSTAEEIKFLETHLGF